MGRGYADQLYWDPAAERIWRYNPEMRLIVILRNPIERLTHIGRWSTGGDDPPFALAIEQEEARCREASAAAPCLLLHRSRFLQLPAQAAVAFLREGTGTGAPAGGTTPEPKDLP